MITDKINKSDYLRPPLWLFWPPFLPASDARSGSFLKFPPLCCPPFLPASDAFSRFSAKLPEPPRCSAITTSGIGLVLPENVNTEKEIICRKYPYTCQQERASVHFFANVASCRYFRQSPDCESSRPVSALRLLRRITTQIIFSE
ncbi:hypothetical protein ESA_02176 [Cronobacter sakazakii ATCC BAA-894]|uniref:Uncharacterized protein n=1 Tax=Cronobacter sakazakii (strain ATCC BAA-894) TaxID=290339 RepID=A7MNT1_CROS8|nr:hypothetical protein ESA_02176 [Cronobacter sakazakii ATCC BAA-894]